MPLEFNISKITAPVTNASNAISSAATSITSGASSQVSSTISNLTSGIPSFSAPTTIGISKDLSLSGISNTISGGVSSQISSTIGGAVSSQISGLVPSTAAGGLLAGVGGAAGTISGAVSGIGNGISGALNTSAITGQIGQLTSKIQIPKIPALPQIPPEISALIGANNAQRAIMLAKMAKLNAFVPKFVPGLTISPGMIAGAMAIIQAAASGNPGEILKKMLANIADDVKGQVMDSSGLGDIQKSVSEATGAVAGLQSQVQGISNIGETLKDQGASALGNLTSLAGAASGGANSLTGNMSLSGITNTLTGGTAGTSISNLASSATSMASNAVNAVKTAVTGSIPPKG